MSDNCGNKSADSDGTGKGGGDDPPLSHPAPVSRCSSPALRYGTAVRINSGEKKGRVGRIDMVTTRLDYVIVVGVDGICFAGHPTRLEVIDEREYQTALAVFSLTGVKI